MPRKLFPLLFPPLILLLAACLDSSSLSLESRLTVLSDCRSSGGTTIQVAIEDPNQEKFETKLAGNRTDFEMFRVSMVPDVDSRVSANSDDPPARSDRVVRVNASHPHVNVQLLCNPDPLLVIFSHRSAWLGPVVQPSNATR